MKTNNEDIRTHDFKKIFALCATKEFLTTASIALNGDIHIRPYFKGDESTYRLTEIIWTLQKEDWQFDIECDLEFSHDDGGYGFTILIKKAVNDDVNKRIIDVFSFLLNDINDDELSIYH